MKKRFLVALAGVVVIAFTLARAGEAPKSGTIVSENSVDCGTKKQGHKAQTDLMCQEYVLRTDTMEYHIRQPKQKDQAMLPLNAPVQYTIDKDKMKLKVQGKSYQFLVVSEAAATPDAKQSAGAKPAGDTKP
jgi:hypothetical protein